MAIRDEFGNEGAIRGTPMARHERAGVLSIASLELRPGSENSANASDCARMLSDAHYCSDGPSSFGDRCSAN